VKIGLRDDFRRIDAEQMRRSGQDEEALVRSAGSMFASVLMNKAGWGPEDPIAVVCGPGNNGADGLSLADCLSRNGFVELAVILSRPSEALPALHRKLLSGLSGVRVIGPGETPGLTGFKRIVDALLGTGVSGGIRESEAGLISAINGVSAETVSLDLPSGLIADDHSDPGICVDADWTITVGLPKICLSYAPARFRAGRILVRDIGFGPELLDRTGHPRERYGEEEAKTDVPSRNPIWYKNCYGHCTLWAGSEGKTGAAVLAASAALRAGAGLVTLISGPGARRAVESVRPETMSFPLEKGMDEVLGFLESKPVLVAGPGIGTGPDEAMMLEKIISRFEGIVVFDADCLTLLARKPVLLEAVRGRSVLTPHLGEAARLLGREEFVPDEAGYGALAEWSRRYGAVVVCKSADTVVFDPESGIQSVNGSGNPGLAKGGSGDVLAGIIGSVIAQKKEAASRSGERFILTSAVRFGVWLHGAAADEAGRKINPRSLTAGDVVDFIPDAFDRFGTAR
jgi:NAD(P)H-hydrate epimerase